MSGAPLLAEIAAIIRETGPIGIDRYMALCLGHPVHGYYRTRDPLGRAGDFTTAPEISQMFGELIGLWIASVWMAMGRPERAILAELGPGRGTLMADALRALRSAAPDAAFALHLVETSPALRARQEEALAGFSPTWHEGPQTLPDGPAIVVANEFFDCLPVRQFERTPRGWCERLVGLSEDGTLTIGLAPEPDRSLAKEGPVGVVTTLAGPAADTMRGLAGRIRAQGGGLLAIDYGHARPGFGDTLQAVAGHAFTDPLAAPGEADLTVHVDFAALARAARAGGAVVHGPVDQRDFLLALGLTLRAERLKRAATPVQSEAVDAAVARLTDTGRGGMGRLFKVLAAAAPGLGPLPGF
ncbi:class I SAM-dependent methyltransferase [Methylobacterium sp. sgz302541]|uniref:class I SAM-dependent methyltransferase n=1 Tax=unclassified Methylobacterium TaxID=2615210 RepID=UPI003D334026